MHSRWFSSPHGLAWLEDKVRDEVGDRVYQPERWMGGHALLDFMVLAIKISLFFLQRTSGCL